MDFSDTREHDSLREAIGRICANFGDDYWLQRDREGGFPHELYNALAAGGWLGICMPTEYGGSGMGNLGGVATNPIPAHGRMHSITLTLPPLGALLLTRESDQ